MTARVILGFAVAFTIAVIARKRALLSTNGAVAAIVLGALSVAAGIGWGALLVAYFITATVLSSWRRSEKTTRDALVVEKPGARDALQVFSNGGVFVALALTAAATRSDFALAASLGAIAASMADTAATEVGGAIGGSPRSIISGQKVPSGLSGGITLAGTLAMFAGAALIGIFARVVGFSTIAAWTGIVGGVAGALADSLLGALLQERRRCVACGALTERRVHNCQTAGAATDVVGGVRGLDNDGVNLTSTVIGAVVAGVLSRGGV
jgi:uncharacterized protein (TIGR00297 family)